MADMRYRPLGDSGLVVSVVGLGCNNLGRADTRTADLDGSREVVDAAIDAGITLFDVADIYGAEPGLSEDLLGQSLVGRRDDVLVATKFGMDMGGTNGPDWNARGSRRYIRRAVEASLRRLRTDYIDLYQYHAPDGITPIDETLAALGELVAEGKVRYVGSSNLAAWQVVEADLTARSAGAPRFISAQNHYSLLERGPAAELAPACQAYGVGLLPFFPLANGLLTGKYRRNEKPSSGTRLGDQKPQLHATANWDLLEALERYADQRSIGLLDVAIGGLAAQPAVSSVIAGATGPEQIKGNVEAGSWDPSPADLAALDEVLTTGS